MKNRYEKERDAFFSVDQNVLINIISYESNVKINGWKTIDESKNLNSKYQNIPYYI